MDILAGWSLYETKFRGESVSMQLRPLYVDEYRTLAPYMRQYDTKEEAVDKLLEMQGKALPVYQERVKDITGITIDGKPVAAEDLARESLLALLAQDILQELFMRSTITKAESKNSEEPSGSSTS